MAPKEGPPVALIVGGAVAVGALLLLSKKKKEGSSMLTTAPRGTWPKTKTPDTKLGKYFTLQEFLKSSTFPKLSHYRLNKAEKRNVSLLVNTVLDPFRAFTKNPILISSGGRPETVAGWYGTTWYDALAKQGLSPAKKSDHTDFSGADLRLTGVKGVESTRAIIAWLKNNPFVRQVGIYLKTTVKGEAKLGHFHVAAITPGKGRLKNFFYFRLDGEAIQAIDQLIA